MKILVVDDSKSVHRYVTDLCQGKTLELDHCFNGREVVEKFKSNPHVRYDAILLDWEMPEMTGPETLDALNALKIGTPVIMMTSKSAPDEIALMLSKGAAEYILKPFTQDILFEKMEDVLKVAV